MNDTQIIAVSTGVTAWLTLEQAQLWIGIGVGVLTIAVLIQRIVINCRAIKSAPSEPS
jgi:hypothetical protein